MQLLSDPRPRAKVLAEIAERLIDVRGLVESMDSRSVSGNAAELAFARDLAVADKAVKRMRGACRDSILAELEIKS